MYKALLWDLDDTLWNFRENGAIALREVFNKFELINIFDSFESFYNIYEKKNQELWELYAKNEITKDYLRLERFLYPLRTAGHEDVDMAREMGPEFLNLTATQTNLVPGAIEILEYYRDKYNMVIISNGFREIQYKKLETSGLLPYFSKIFLSDEVGFQKPDPRFFESVLRQMQLRPKECLVIGDNFETDIIGATNVDIDSVYFDRDGTGKSISKPCFFRIESLCEMKEILL